MCYNISIRKESDNVEKVVIKIKGSDIPKRNELHFEVQKNTRKQVVQSKKVYNRKKLRKVEW